MRWLALLLLLVPLAACADRSGSGNQASAEAENAAVAVAAAAGGDRIGAGTSPAAPDNTEIADRRSSGEPDADDDACGASRYRWLVGRPRSAIPEEPANANWRIACTGCPITMDYSPTRLNIFYDTETERIDEVRCG